MVYSGLILARGQPRRHARTRQRTLCGGEGHERPLVGSPERVRNSGNTAIGRVNLAPHRAAPAPSIRGHWRNGFPLAGARDPLGCMSGGVWGASYKKQVARPDVPFCTTPPFGLHTSASTLSPPTTKTTMSPSSTPGAITTRPILIQSGPIRVSLRAVCSHSGRGRNEVRRGAM